MAQLQQPASHYFRISDQTSPTHPLIADRQ